MASTDVLVIGGGAIGLSCAWRLARRGAKVSLVEANRCGGGASGASLGALWPSTSSNRSGSPSRLHRASLRLFENFCAEIRENSGVDPIYNLCGRLELISTDKRRRQAEFELDSYNREWSDWRESPAIELMTHSIDIQAVEPSVCPAEYGALRCRVTARVDPGRLVEGLTACCRKAGVEIREDCRCNALDLLDDKVAGAQTAAGPLRAGHVLIAAGAWTRFVSEECRREAPVRPVRGQALLVRSESPLFSHIIKCGGIYLVPLGDGHTLIGATTETRSGFDGRTTLEGLSSLMLGAAQVVPALKNAHVARVWAGLRPMGADKKPYIGRSSRFENLWYATGHYKTGIGMAPVTGEIIAELISNGATGYDIGDIQPGRGNAA